MPQSKSRRHSEHGDKENECTAANPPELQQHNEPDLRITHTRHKLNKNSHRQGESESDHTSTTSHASYASHAQLPSSNGDGKHARTKRKLRDALAINHQLTYTNTQLKAQLEFLQTEALAQRHKITGLKLSLAAAESDCETLRDQQITLTPPSLPTPISVSQSTTETFDIGCQADNEAPQSPKEQLFICTACKARDDRRDVELDVNRERSGKDRDEVECKSYEHENENEDVSVIEVTQSFELVGSGMSVLDLLPLDTKKDVLERFRELRNAGRRVWKSTLIIEKNKNDIKQGNRKVDNTYEYAYTPNLSEFTTPRAVRKRNMSGEEGTSSGGSQGRRSGWNWDTDA